MSLLVESRSPLTPLNKGGTRARVFSKSSFLRRKTRARFFSKSTPTPLLKAGDKSKILLKVVLLKEEDKSKILL
ncbi:MAG TPA: hypothetical protein DD001_16345, partial [Microcoleaceae bacterium UBA10368]|nr:hypothetical protein [Microcoleaceae cyanobacterium UBA10368]